MEFRYLSIGLSLVLGALYVAYLRRFDVHEREPFGKMALTVVVGGMVSITLAGVLYVPFLAVTGSSEAALHNPLAAFLVIGPVEESAKFLGFAAVYGFLKKDMNEINDGIMYMACVALGFSLIENYHYANASAGARQLLFLRILISTPVHISVSSYMGIAAFRVFKGQKKAAFLIPPLLWASFQHGLFDAAIFTGMGLIVSIVILVFNDRAMKMLMKYANARSPFRIVLKDYLQREPSGVEPGIPCENCGAVEGRPTHILGGIRIQKCSCGFHVCTVASLKRIFSRLAPEFKSLRKEVSDREKNGTWYKSLYQSNYMNMKTGNAFFDVDELHDCLESINRKILDSLKGKRLARFV